MDNQALQKLLRDFNVRGYVGDITYKDNGRKGSVLTLSEGSYMYEDEFYGGEPYSGNETIWENGVPLFRVVYWGKIVKGNDAKEIYPIMKKALVQGPSTSGVHRGPLYSEIDGYVYETKTVGDITEFSLIETISKEGVEVYRAYFYGGIINR